MKKIIFDSPKAQNLGADGFNLDLSKMEREFLSNFFRGSETLSESDLQRAFDCMGCIPESNLYRREECSVYMFQLDEKNYFCIVAGEDDYIWRRFTISIENFPVIYKKLAIPAAAK